MGLLQVTGKGSYDILFFAQGHIQDELHIDPAGSGDHVLVDGVVLEDACLGPWAGDGFKRVVFVDRLFRADARQDALASARKTRKEMRLDEALRHQQVALGSEAVHIEAGTRGQGAQIDEICFAERIVHRDVLLIDDLVAKHPALLLFGRRTVQAGGDQNGDVGVRLSGPYLGQQQRQGELAGNGAGVVRCDQNDLLFAFCQLAQAGRPDGMLQCLLHDGGFRLAGVILMHPGRQDGGQILLFHMQRECLAAIGDMDFSQDILSSL